MAGILTTTDATTLVPSLSSLDTNTLGAMVNYINYLVESPEGANRPLGITKWTEKIRLTLKLQNCYLAYHPLILNDQTNYPYSFKVRIADALNYYGRAVPVQPWLSLDNTMIQIDDDSQVSLFLTQAYFYNYPEFSQSIRTIATEMLASYYAGFNLVPLTSNPDPVVYNLKMAAGEIIKYYTSKLYAGIGSLSVPFDEFDISFNQKGSPYQVPDYLLAPFRKYKPYIRY